MKNWLNLGFLAVVLLIWAISNSSFIFGLKAKDMFIHLQEDLLPIMTTTAAMERDIFKIDHEVMDYLAHEDISDVAERRIMEDLDALRDRAEQYVENAKIIHDFDQCPVHGLIPETEKFKSTVMRLISIKKRGADLDDLWKKEGDMLHR